MKDGRRVEEGECVVKREMRKRKGKGREEWEQARMCWRRRRRKSNDIKGGKVNERESRRRIMRKTRKKRRKGGKEGEEVSEREYV